MPKARLATQFDLLDWRSALNRDERCWRFYGVQESVLYKQRVLVSHASYDALIALRHLTTTDRTKTKLRCMCVTSLSRRFSITMRQLAVRPTAWVYVRSTKTVSYVGRTYTNS